jgi:gluconolactonase
MIPVSKSAGRQLDRDWNSGVVGYPDPAVEHLDRRFEKYRLLSAAIERLWTGGRWTEGPVWFGDGRYLLFSDIPNERILRWAEETGAVTVFRSPSGSANGNTRDRQGRLITCEQLGRRVTRTEIDGTITVLMERFDGKRLNAPNDVIVHPDGAIWFSDPGYGILSNYEGCRAEFELPTRVYRLDPATGWAMVAVEGLTRPNGLCFSPDYRHLYVVDTGCTDDPAHDRGIMRYEIDERSAIGRGVAFCDMAPGRSDGIRCDTEGNLWAASGFGGAGSNGVHVFAPDGTRLAKIHLPEPCSNLCFGGPKRNRLFMTGSQSLYSIYVEAQGVPYA